MDATATTCDTYDDPTYGPSWYAWTASNANYASRSNANHTAHYAANAAYATRTYYGAACAAYYGAAYAAYHGAPYAARTSCADCATAPAAAFSGGKVLQSERAHEDARGQGEHGDMDGGDAIWVSWISL